MKINFPALFQTPLHKYKVFLIFGNDTTVFERAQYFLQEKLSLIPKILAENELASTASFQSSLFESSEQCPLYLIPHASDKILSHLDSLRQGVYIFTSEKARAQSKLVLHFTKSSNTLAIAAYASPLTTSEFEFLIEGINLSPTLKSQLFKAYQNDYRGLLNALAQLRLYGNEVPDSYDDFFSNSSAPAEEFMLPVHGFLGRDLKKVTETTCLLTSADLIPFLRILARSFFTLLELMPFKGSSTPIAWHSLKAPVFFKDQPLFESALKRWDRDEISSFLRKILTLEYQIKYSGYATSQVLPSLFLELKPC
jgi:DNA polymerase III delta subunit